MTLEPRNFYHSFPRPGRHDSRADILRKGMEILQSISEFGLVLTPEVITWKQPLSNGEYRTVTNRQCRLSLTELSRPELPGHGEHFGPYSLEFGIDVLRRLGALPTIYMPQHLLDDNRLSALGATVVAQLHDIKYTIRQLNQLHLLGDPASLMAITGGQANAIEDDAIVKLGNIDDKGNTVRTFPVPLKTLKGVLEYIGYRNAPFDLMVGVLSLVESLFYPTDDERHDDLLAYYRQREWRLCPGLVVEGVPHGRPLSEGEKARLLGIDEEFWAAELSDGKETFRRVDSAFTIDVFHDRRVIELASAVIVPPEVAGEARRFFGDRVVVIG